MPVNAATGREGYNESNMRTTVLVEVAAGRADVIHGYGGADKIYAKAGADHVYAGRDNKRDKVYAGPGADRIRIRIGDTEYAGRGTTWSGSASRRGGA
jgi:hypothetical protein